MANITQAGVFDLMAEPEGKISKNIAMDHISGKLTDDQLLGMANRDLVSLAFTFEPTSKDDLNGPRRIKSVRAEQYRRTSDRKKAELQGGEPNEIFWGVHRAFLLIKRRKEENKQPERPLTPEEIANNQQKLKEIREMLYRKLIVKRYA